MKSSTRSALAAGAIATALLGGVSAGSVAHAAEPAQTTHNVKYDSMYGSSTFHVYADGVDWSKPVGAVYYFDGDYWSLDQSKVGNPEHKDLKAMAKVANDRNMVFVALVSPDKDPSGDGITWWQDANKNGDYARALMKQFNEKHGIDTSNVWTVGYSGGAELQAFELGADRQDSWRSGGGDVLFGGGGTNGMQTAPSASAKAVPMTWVVGQNDGEGVTWPATWSAYGAAHQGRQAYVDAGFTNTSVKVIPGVDHYGYDFAGELAAALDKAGGSAPSTEPVNNVQEEAPVSGPEETALGDTAPVDENVDMNMSDGSSAVDESMDSSPVNPDMANESMMEATAPVDAGASQDAGVPQIGSAAEVDTITPAQASEQSKKVLIETSVDNNGWLLFGGATVLGLLALAGVVRWRSARNS